MQEEPSIALSLIRAVRVADTSITLSFKTNEPAIGKVVYADSEGSKFTLTDSIPQMDHLFTIDQLDPKHGYSFALTASVSGAKSNTYTVLLAPESIGMPGTSRMPGFVETNAQGGTVSIASASSDPAISAPIAPWWFFALLLTLVLASWIGYAWYGRTRMSKPQ